MNYWDSSALIEAVQKPEIRQRLENETAFTRPHALAETFSVLTGNPATRISANDAARVIEYLSKSLSFVDITGEETLSALKAAEKKGVRGGRVHDYLHAVAAEKCKADKIVTLDKNDFNGLTRLETEAA